MLGLLHLLLEKYKPNPNGFRFHSVGIVAFYAVATAPPVVLGLLARSRVATAVISAMQALSPLALLSAMRDPTSDINFALLLWWFPVPALVAVVVVIDRAGWLARRR
jgi:hypothetical protein